MEALTPITFKTLSKTSSGDAPIDTLELTYFNIEAFKPAKENGYYLLTSHSDPSHPLRIYPSAMAKLARQLEFAFSEAQDLEQQHRPDNEQYDCGTINKHGSMMVRLVLSTFQERVNIWLRLYTLGEEGAILPTKTGVRFSVKDDVDAISKFITKNKYKLID